MPKMKSNRGAVKRFRLTASGKIKREHAYAGHLFTGKTRERKRRLRHQALVADVDARRIRKLIAC
jgi:large subunit ribosomal protein L35